MPGAVANPGSDPFPNLPTEDIRINLHAVKSGKSGQVALTVGPFSSLKLPKELLLWDTKYPFPPLLNFFHSTQK